MITDDKQYCETLVIPQNTAFRDISSRNYALRETTCSNHAEGGQNDFKIVTKGWILYPNHVQTNLVRHDLFTIDLVRVVSLTQDDILVHILDGGPVSDARTYPEHLPLLVGILQYIAEHFRPGAYQTHVTLQHVPQLGEFVELGFTDETSHTRDARVAANGYLAAPVGMLLHGAELIELKEVAISADTLLGIDTTTLTLQSYQDVDEQEQRRQEQ